MKFTSAISLLALAPLALAKPIKSEGCTPNDNQGFTLVATGTWIPAVQGKTIQLKDGRAGIDFSSPDSNAVPFTQNGHMYIPGPGDGKNLQGFIDARTYQLRFSNEGRGGMISFQQRCEDYMGEKKLVLAANGDSTFLVCKPENTDTLTWTLHHGRNPGFGNACVTVKLLVQLG